MKNRRHIGMARFWAAPLIDWLSLQTFVNSTAKVLDFGCGYFDVGSALVPLTQRVDGFDICPFSISEAKRLNPTHNSSLFEKRSDIPESTYDLIVVNSVLQYLPTETALEETLLFLKSRLRNGGRLLLTDLIPPNYSAGRDAIENLWTVLPHGLALPMVTHLARALFTRNQQPLTKISPSWISDFALRRGAEIASLPQNLTPSRQRFSVLLHWT